jgi:hypothetical protein
MDINNANNADLRFLTNNTERVRLTSTSLYTASGISIVVGASSPVLTAAGRGNVTINGSSTAIMALAVGGAAKGWVYHDSTNMEINAGSTGSLSLLTGGVNRLLIDASGNAGFGGVTPSAWATLKPIQFAGGASLAGFSNTGYLGANCYFDGSWKYIATATTGRYEVAADHKWFSAPSGTAGDAISFTQAMTLDANSSLMVGTTTALARLTLSKSGGSAGAVNNQIAMTHDGASTGYYISTIRAAGSDEPAGLAFKENATERARIDSSGNLLVGTTSSTGNAHILQTGGSGIYSTQFISSTASSPYGSNIYFSGAAPNGTSNQFLYCNDSSALRMEVRSNGGIANYSANNVNLSDRREKTNFAPAKSYLDVICAIPVQTFNYIDQNLEEDGGLTLGVVAQDVQAVAPELVMESNWAGKDQEPKMRLSIYQTDLQYALMKCIQEQQALIESLRQRLSAANL